MSYVHCIRYQNIAVSITSHLLLDLMLWRCVPRAYVVKTRLRLLIQRDAPEWRGCGKEVGPILIEPIVSSSEYDSARPIDSSMDFLRWEVHITCCWRNVECFSWLSQDHAFLVFSHNDVTTFKRCFLNFPTLSTTTNFRLDWVKTSARETQIGESCWGSKIVTLYWSKMRLRLERRDEQGQTSFSPFAVTLNIPKAMKVHDANRNGRRKGSCPRQCATSQSSCRVWTCLSHDPCHFLGIV